MNPVAGDLKRTVLTVFDAHDAFPIFTLRLLRSGGNSDGEGVPPSLPPQPTAPDSTGGSATEDWTIVSGGGDGTVAHWSVVGLASPSEVAGGTEEAGVELHKIGNYEVRASFEVGWFVWRFVSRRISKAPSCVQGSFRVGFATYGTVFSHVLRGIEGGELSMWGPISIRQTEPNPCWQEIKAGGLVGNVRSLWRNCCHHLWA